MWVTADGKLINFKDKSIGMTGGDVSRFRIPLLVVSVRTCRIMQHLVGLDFGACKNSSPLLLLCLR